MTWPAESSSRPNEPGRASVSRGAMNPKGLLQLLQPLRLIALCACLSLATVQALYEDQVGKFDWRQTYVGEVRQAHFDTVSSVKKVIVSTQENVVAALNIKTGQILWRQVLEEGSQGTVHLLHVADEAVTVSGKWPTMIRGWDLNNGYNLWEWTLWLPVAAQDSAVEGIWWVENNFLHHLLPFEGDRLEFTSYNYKTGHNRGATSKIAAQWVNNNCVLSAPFYTCISNVNNAKQLLTLDVTSNAVKIFTKSILSIIPNLKDGDRLQLKSLLGPLPGIEVNNQVLLLKSDGFHLTNVQLKDETTSTFVVKINDRVTFLQSHYSGESLQVTANDIEDGAPMIEYTNSIPLPGANYPKIASSMCAKTPKNNLACRLLVIGEDSAVYLLQNPGKTIWTREEGLAKIVGVEMLDLPVSELEAVIETEFDNKEGDILGMLFRRLKSQFAQLKSLFNTILHTLVPHLGHHSDDGAAENLLVRDEFGLHKIVIVVAHSGKVFAIDNLSGGIIWKRYIPSMAPFNSADGTGHVLLYTQRTTRHLPYDAQCAIIAKHKSNGHGLIFMFNPITGAGVDVGILNLNSKVKQAVLLHQMNNEFLKGIVIMDESDKLHIYPESCAQYIGTTFIYVADPLTAVVQGYVLNNNNGKMEALKTWTIRLGGLSSAKHRITNVAMKNPIERVHSQGKVMGDRSVLYKYINPNLVAFTTEGPDPVHKDILNLYLVDVVSGAIVMVQSHRRARGPVRVVHAENWVVYSYYSEKSRRPEMATIELYEGPKRSGGAFSSLQTGRWPPEIARQAFVLPSPAPPLGLAATITDRGITPKDILISLSTGSIVELPWALLDPRRPTVPMTNEMREEGLLQYTPELPLPSEATINYNQTVINVKNMHTSPSGLESTCLVFAYGLDIFYTRVAPSKTFDLLKEDFDYNLIVLVLIALIVSTYAAKRFASRKVLRQAWK